MFSTEEEARAHVQAQLKQAEQRQHGAERMVEELNALRASATSSEREVTVTLGHAGNVVDVQFDRIDGLDAVRLGAAVLEANRLAQQQVLAAVERLAAEHYGESTATTRVFTQQYRSMLGGSADEQGAEAAR